MKYFTAPDKAMPSEITADRGEGGMTFFFKEPMRSLRNIEYDTENFKLNRSNE